MEERRRKISEICCRFNIDFSSDTFTITFLGAGCVLLYHKLVLAWLNGNVFFPTKVGQLVSPSKKFLKKLLVLTSGQKVRNF